MIKKEFLEQVKKSASLQYDIWKKWPDYVVMTFTLGNSKQKGDYIGYNIYTPDAHHNSYEIYEPFIEFMELLIRDGVVDVRIKVLEKQLRAAQESQANTLDLIVVTKKELAILKKKKS